MNNKKVLINALKNLGSAKAPAVKKDIVVNPNMGAPAMMFPQASSVPIMKSGGTKMLSVKKSTIDGAGKGLFAEKGFRKNQLIGLAHEDGQPVGEIGNMHNHSDNPNMYSIKQGNERYVYAKRDIEPGEELTTNYRLQPELEQPEDFMRNGGSILKKKQLGGLTRFMGQAGKMMALPPITNTIANTAPSILNSFNSISQKLPTNLLDQGTRDLLNYPILDITAGESNFRIPDVTKYLGDFEFKPFSDGWQARNQMMNMASIPQKMLSENDFYTENELINLVNQQSDWQAARNAFDEMNPEDPRMAIFTALTGDNSRDELFSNLFPNASMPNFRSKFTTPSQEFLLQKKLPWQYSIKNRGMLDPTSLKNINSIGDTLPRTYQDLLKSQKDNWFLRGSAKDVVNEMRGGLRLSLKDIKDASPEQLEKWRQEIVKKMNKQVLDRWHKDILTPYKGINAWEEITNQAGYKNKYGGISKKQLGGNNDSKVSKLEGDLISKIIMNRNRGVDFVDRAFALGNNPGTPLFNIPDDENFGEYMSHKMEWGEDDNGQTWMWPSVLNPNNEAIPVPNQYADYISSEGYKNATGMNQYDASNDYIEAELTPEEIEEYAKGGYIVEDISVPSLTKAQGGKIIKTGSKAINNLNFEKKIMPELINLAADIYPNRERIIHYLDVEDLVKPQIITNSPLTKSPTKLSQFLNKPLISYTKSKLPENLELIQSANYSDALVKLIDPKTKVEYGKLDLVKHDDDWYRPQMISVKPELWGHGIQDVLYQGGIDLVKPLGYKGIRSGDVLISPQKTAKAHSRFDKEILSNPMHYANTEGDPIPVAGLTQHKNKNLYDDFFEYYKSIPKDVKDKYSINDLYNMFTKHMGKYKREYAIGAGSAISLPFMMDTIVIPTVDKNYTPYTLEWLKSKDKLQNIDINKNTNKKQLGGSMSYNLGDEVDEATMNELKKLGYTFEEL